jgi:hypothetical protein
MIPVPSRVLLNAGGWTPPTQHLVGVGSGLARPAWLRFGLRTDPSDDRRGRPEGPLIGPADDLDSEAPGAEWGDDQAAVCVGGSVWAWQGGQRATRRSRSKSPWARLTMWWDLEGAPQPDAQPLQRARRDTVRWIRQVPDVLASLVFLESTGGS